MTNGRYSGAIPKFRKLMEESLKNPKLWELQEHLAVLDAAAKHAADRMDELDTPDFRVNMVRLLKRANSDDEEESDRGLAAATALADRGANEDRAIEAFVSATERLAKRLERAWSIKLDAAQALNARDMVALLARMVDIIVRETNDPEISTRVVTRIDQEIMEGSVGPPHIRGV